MQTDSLHGDIGQSCGIMMVDLRGEGGDGDGGGGAGLVSGDADHDGDGEHNMHA